MYRFDTLLSWRNRHFIQSHRNAFYVTTLVLLVILTCTVNDPGIGYISWAGDTAFPIDIDNYIENISSPWLDYSIGFPNQYYSYTVYYSFFKAITLATYTLGFSAVAVFYFLFLTPTALLSYVAFLQITKKPLTAFLLSVSYSFNPYTLYIFEYTWVFSPFLCLYAGAPLLYVSLVKILFARKQQDEPNKYYFNLAIGAFLVSPAYGNFPFFIANMIGLNSLGIFSWVALGGGVIKRLVLANIIVSLFSLWAFYGQLPEMLFLATQNNISNYSIPIDQWILWQALSLTKVILLNPILGRVHDSGFSYFLNAIWVALLISATLVWSVRSLKHVLATSLIATGLVLMFLVNKGGGWLPPEVTVAIFTSTPILASLRSNDKASVIIPAILFVLVASSFGNRIKFYVLLLAASVLGAYPFFLGGIQTIHSIGRSSGGQNYVIPMPRGLPEAISYINIQLPAEDCYITWPYSAFNSVGWATVAGWNVVGMDPMLYSTKARGFPLDYPIGSSSYGQQVAEGNVEISNLQPFKDMGCKFIVENQAAYSSNNRVYRKLLSDMVGIKLIQLIWEEGDIKIYTITNAHKTQIYQCDQSSFRHLAAGSKFPDNQSFSSCAIPSTKVISPDRLVVSTIIPASGAAVVLLKAWRPFWSMTVSAESSGQQFVVESAKAVGAYQMWSVLPKDPIVLTTVPSKVMLTISYNPWPRWQTLFCITTVVLFIWLLCGLKKIIFSVTKNE